MTAEQKHVVLLSLVGTAPAVLTETVWALAHDSEPVIPNRIIAMTTATGAARLREKLFDGGHWEQLQADLKADGIEIVGKLRFGPISESIRVFPDASRSRELDDIRSAEDNEAVAEFFMEIIRSFVENDSIRLIVSIAGGRKTTSALLYSVMSLLGRAEDQIQHILVDDQWVLQPDFMYPGCKGQFIDRDSGNSLCSKDVNLQLVDVPFVPLRYLFERDLQHSAGSFVALINQVRNRSINVSEDLAIQLGTLAGRLLISGQEIALSANEFLLYLYFARRVCEGRGPIASYGVITEDELSDLAEEFKVSDNFNHWSHNALSNTFDSNEDPRKWLSSIRGKLRKAGFEGYQVDRLVPRAGHIAIELPQESVSIEA
ncbi:CRISPR-associated ring nuclease Csm6 [Cerasicoccus fimbriatus]|uniref:CRISPR-associated ring nuclease Csm6 n=1 Tax=Cerasicoccus fimbriatus TaxID=3014554 RepID=UPI0022B4050C|nr:CRISPR-associated ring nuclease Csm6 [Cerasicoccus sp. TK19100]